MSKEIEVEKAKNQKEEKVPMFQTYYQAFTRHEGGEWFTSGSASLDKNNVISLGGCPRKPFSPSSTLYFSNKSRNTKCISVLI